MYFDPGTGSMIIQIIIGVIAGGGALIVAFKNKIVGLFKGKNKDDKSQK